MGESMDVILDNIKLHEDRIEFVKDGIPIIKLYDDRLK